MYANGTAEPITMADLLESKRLKMLESVLRNVAPELIESTLDQDFGGTDDAYDRLRDRDGDGWTRVLPNVPSDRRGGQNWPFWRTEQELARLRQESRMNAGSNSYGEGLLSNLVNHIIGKGYSYKAVPQDKIDADKSAPGQQIDDTTASYVSMVQEVIDGFCAENRWNCAADPLLNVNNGPTREREACSRVFEDGEAVIRLFHVNAEGRKGRTYVRFVEPEQIRNPPGGLEKDGWSFGIRHQVQPYEDVERVECYWLQYPNQQLGNKEQELNKQGEFVSAEEIVHIKRSKDKAAQKRGTPAFIWSTGAALRRAEKLQRYSSIGATIRAATAEIWKHAFGTQSQIRSLADSYRERTRTDAGTGRSETVETVKPGMIRRVPEGQEPIQPASSTGVPEHQQAAQGDLRMAASAFAAPEYMVGSDASNANFASTKEAGTPFVRSTEGEQEHFKAAFLSVVYKVVRWASECGCLPSDVFRRIKIQVEAPSPAMADPTQQTARREILFRNGVMSAQTWMAQEGFDSRIEMANRAEWDEQMGPQPGLDGLDGMFGGGGGDRPKGPSKPPTPTQESLLEEDEPEAQDDEEERLQSIADILYHVFGDEAGKLFDGKAETAESVLLLPGQGVVLLEWTEADHPRGKGGRFIPKNSPEAVAAAKDQVKSALKNPKTADSHQKLVEHLNILTVAQLHDLKKEYGIKASAKDSEGLKRKLADRLDRGRREEPKEDEGKKEAEQSAEKSAEPAKEPLKADERKGKKAKAKSEKARTLHQQIVDRGGIDPKQITKDWSFKDDIVSGGMLGILKKGGATLDEMAQTLQKEGELRVPANRNADDYLMEQLQGKAKSALHNYDQELEAEQAEYHRELENARQHADESEIEEVRRANEKAGEEEGRASEVSLHRGELADEENAGWGHSEDDLSFDPSEFDSPQDSKSSDTLSAADGEKAEEGSPADSANQEPPSKSLEPEDSDPVSIEPKAGDVEPVVTSDPISEPSTPSAEAGNKADKDGLPPRQKADAVAKADQSEYEFARASAVPNIGKDLKGSARHKANAWKGLAEAEKDGSAAELVTAKNLFRLDPHNLTETMTPANVMQHMAAHLAFHAFPSEPGDYSSRLPEKYRKSSPQQLRQQYHDAFQEFKKTALEVANSGKSPTDALNTMKGKALSILNRLRANEGGDGPDDYNPVANGFAKLHNSLIPRRRPPANSVAGRLDKFHSLSTVATSGMSDAEKSDHVHKAAMSILEGQSFNEAFGQKKEGAKVKRFDPAMAYVAKAERKGGKVIDASTVDAAGKYMLNTLKLSGVQYGNYVSDGERQHHISKAAEALTDLSEVTGIPEEVIGFNGKLGLAIGARGKSNALAHYEPKTQVINLTRAGGVGSLAHEWGHAFDHYLGGFGRKLLSNNTHGTERTPLKDAMASVKEAIRSSGAYDRIREELAQQIEAGGLPKNAKDYWLSDAEMFARCFERHVQHKLHGEERENTYLVGLRKDGHPFWPNKEESERIAPAMEALFEAARAYHSNKQEAKT